MQNEKFDVTVYFRAQLLQVMVLWPKLNGRTATACKIEKKNYS
jgi:hypothetical protein